MNNRKIFIVGLPRTGTTSVCEFFLRHQFATAHCAYTKTAFELATVIADTPVFADYSHLAKQYPNAQFVLNTRTLDSWLPSIKHLLAAMKKGLFDGAPLFHQDVTRCFLQVFSPLTEATFQDDEHLSACFDAHHQNTRKRLAKRLVEIRIDDPHAPDILAEYLGFTHDGLGLKPLNRRGHIGDWRKIDHHLKIKANRQR